MSISPEALRGLYRRLVSQDTYPGGVCPNDEVLEAYHGARLDAQQSKLVAEHIEQCPSCKEEYQVLVLASSWFRQNETGILGGLAWRATEEEILPWSRCPSVGLLYRLLRDEIPHTHGGQALIGEMREHLSKCPQCAQWADEFSKAMKGRHMSVLDLGRQARSAMSGWVRGFTDDLVDKARATGFPRLGACRHGYRSDKSITLKAPVLDVDGSLIVDEKGLARQCVFEVLRAEIQDDGFLNVSLAATDREYFAAERVYTASMHVHAGEAVLDAPAEAINEAGQVTFTGLLPGAKPIEVLPLPYLDVTVLLGPPKDAGQGR
jgi:hypothetical protein